MTADAATITSDLLCPTCGYNLRGLTQARCPECGVEFDRARLSDSQLPWLQRRHRGRIRTYWRTAWRISNRPRTLTAEFCRPVLYADALRFRLIAVCLAWLPLAITTGLHFAGDQSDFLALHQLGFISDPWLATGFLAASLLALITITGVPSYFFHPRRLSVDYQNRGIALSYYACAPLALSPLFYPISAFVHAVFTSQPIGTYLYLGFMVLLFGFWWRNLARLIARILRQEAGATVLAYLYIPTVALLAGAVVFFVVDWSVQYFGLIWFSLRD